MATATKNETCGRAEIIRDFKAHVNMTANELEKYLQTDHSKQVGWKGDTGHDDSAESVGHQSGERIVELLREKKTDYGDDDLAHMKKVIGYVNRHLAQRPGGDVSETRWRYSLINWGHDPLKNE